MIGQLATWVNEKDYIQWSGCQTVSRKARIPSERLLGGKKLWFQKVGDLITYKSHPKSTYNHVVSEHKNKL